MTPAERKSRSRALHFVLGLLLSIVLWTIVAPLWAYAGIVAALHNPAWQSLAAPGLILVPAVAGLTYLAVRNSWPRAIGALIFYPFVALAAYEAYDAYIGRPMAAKRAAAVLEAEAMKLDYSSRQIAQPLGTIDVLGIPLAAIRGKHCWDTCARLLLNGIANEVAAVSFDARIDLADANPTFKDGPPWTFRRYRLGRGQDCLPPLSTVSWTGADVQWIQSNGVFDVCIVMSRGDARLGDMILIDEGIHARRPHGPEAGPIEGAAVAYRVTYGALHEIVRWEWGVYPASGRSAPGKSFTLIDFAKALSGRGETDRLSNQYAMTLREAIERVHSSLDTMPNIDGWSPFEFLRKVHEHEMGRGKPRAALDPDLAAKLRELPAVICRERSRSVTAKACFQRYNEVVAVIFAPDIAAGLRMAKES
jgi:hypothetical protein